MRKQTVVFPEPQVQKLAMCAQWWEFFLERPNAYRGTVSIRGIRLRTESVTRRQVPL